jgi:hypothetical protein
LDHFFKYYAQILIGGISAKLEEDGICVISGFCCSVNDIFALFCDIMQCILVVIFSNQQVGMKSYMKLVMIIVL